MGCNLLGYGTTSGQTANQARIFAARPAIRARLNTVYIFAVFAGGAVGSAVAAVLFSAFGWSGVVFSGLGFLLLAGVVLRANANSCDSEVVAKDLLAEWPRRRSDRG